MNNKLFWVCPFSCMENFLRNNFGNECYFITSMATKSQFHEIEYLEAVKKLIIYEDITQFFIVNDTSCRFINSILKGDKTFGTPAEKNIQNILIDNFSIIKRQHSMAAKAKLLAQLNIKQQALEIVENELFNPLIIQNNILIRGLITTKSENIIKEISLITHEL